MKNVTITMREGLARQARVEAAKEGKSLSRFVCELVERRIGQKSSQREALERFLAAPLLPLTDENGKLPTREEMYDDALFRRHQYSDLHEGSENAGEARNSQNVASRDRRP